MEQELEVKILNTDIEKIKERAILLGAKRIGHEKQINTVISSSSYDLIGEDSYLRIRQLEELDQNISKNQLTFKKKIQNDTVRENYEYTIEFDNVEMMKEILRNLQLDQMAVGYKERISYEFKGARLDFDYWDKETYPYPYMEIEVKKQEDLKEILRALEISEENLSTKSITQLQRELKDS